jgi:ribonucleotide reductase beta subunit family protein with ferritin-like domain
MLDPHQYIEEHTFGGPSECTDVESMVLSAECEVVLPTENTNMRIDCTVTLPTECTPEESLCMYPHVYEWLLTERDEYARLNLFPITERSRPFWDSYKTVQKMLWFTEEIDLVQDVSDFQTLSADEQYFLEMILAFFAQADSIVTENVVTRLYDEVKDASARAFYGLQIAFENVHSETYNVILDTLIQDPIRKNQLFHAINTVPSIQAKAQFALSYIDSGSNFATRLAAFACVEGIQFSSSFCAIFWLKQKGKMPGLTHSNELISRDKAMHCDFSVLAYKSLEHPLPVDVLRGIIHAVVKIELDFVDDALRCNLIGMNASQMKDYVQFVGDYVCGLFDVPILYGTDNPFEFMDNICLQGKTNFFEKRVSEYQKQPQAAPKESDFGMSPVKG